MTSLLDSFKQSIIRALDPQHNRKETELSYLRQVYNNAPGIKRNQWYRIATEVGNLVGFSFSCACGQEYQLLSINDWLRDYHCPQCKTEFDLLKTVGITSEISPTRWPEFFAKLPVRPRLAGIKQPRVIDTWSSSDEGVGYERTDPGTSGLF